MSIDWARVIRGIHSIASASRPADAYPSIASRRLSGSSAPTRSAPLSAPFNDAASGPSTQRMTPAPFSTSAREPSAAPAASKSASAIDAPSPAPRSTATLAPSAMNFFTVSGMAAQRVSPAASFRTAIFMPSLEDQKNDQADDEADDRSPEHHLREALIIANMRRHLLASGMGKQRFFFLGHDVPSWVSKRGRVHNKPQPAAQA